MVSVENSLDYNDVFKFMEEFKIDVINRFKELIIDMPSNTYVSIDKCESIEDVITRVVYAVCRPIGKGLEPNDANRIRKKVNDYFKKNLTRNDFLLMYGSLCYESKLDELKEFIRRGFPIHELETP